MWMDNICRIKRERYSDILVNILVFGKYIGDVANTMSIKEIPQGNLDNLGQNLGVVHWI